MDILQAFILDGTTNDITIQWKDETPLFLPRDIGNILGIKNIRTSIKHFDDDEKVINTIDGKETICLTQQGLLRLIMSSRKPIARPLQKWIPKVLTTIRQTGKFEMNDKEIEQATTCIQQEAKTLHSSLIEEFKGPNKNVVFFGKIQKTNKNTSQITIGSTNDIKEFSKQNAHIHMFYVMCCTMNEAFEKFLHSHSYISALKCKEPYRIDVFEMTENHIQKTLRIAKCNLHLFSSHASAGKVLEMQQQRLSDSDNESDYINPIVLYGDNRKYTQARGQKVQCYSQDGKTLLQTYEGHTDAIRKLALEDPSALRIKAAIQNKTVYRGFRWASLDRHLANDTFQDIGETKESIQIKKGLVAMLNITKTRIEKVYSDQKEAKEDRQLKSAGAVCSALKLQRKCQGHYFMMWNDCSDELQSDYIARGNTLPEKRQLSTSRSIEKLHPITGNPMQKYASVADVLHEMRISRKSLQNAAEFGYIVKGFKWRYAE